MAKLSRITASVFGSAAGIQDVGVFGSLAEGSPQYSFNPATVQSLSNWADGWFSAFVGNNSPAGQDLNAVPYVLSYELAYAYQAGVPEYDGSTVYYQNSYCNFGGALYVSGSNSNLGNTPSGSSVYWSFVAGSSSYTQGSAVSVSGSGTTVLSLGSATIVSNGRPVMICLSPAANGSFSKLYVQGLGNASLLTFLRDGSAITVTELGVNNTAGGTAFGGFFPVTQIQVDFPTAGSHTYSVTLEASTNSSYLAQASNLQLSLIQL